MNGKRILVCLFNLELKEDEKIRQLNSMFWNLSSLKQEVFKFLVEHLARVIALSEKNKMNVGNIGVIFAPMLFDYSDALGGESPNRASTLFSRGGANLSGLEIYKQSTVFLVNIDV